MSYWVSEASDKEWIKNTLAMLLFDWLKYALPWDKKVCQPTEAE